MSEQVYRTLGPPKGNFNIFDSPIVKNIKERISICGENSVEFYNAKEDKFYEFPTYCNNRCCENPGCKDHRGYLYMKSHLAQIQTIDAQIKKPKGFVFSDIKKPLKEFNKKYIRYRMKKLYNLLERFSLTPFSIHLELKLYPDTCDLINQHQCKKCIHKEKYNCKNGDKCRFSGLCFLHFHVITGFIDKLGVVRKIWGFHVSSQKAISKNLTNYVAKYASKTPIFANEENQFIYGLLVYKTQMHRFSIKPTEILSEFSGCSDWVCVDLLIGEIKSTIQRNRKRHRYWGHFTDFAPIIDKPPDIDNDVYGYYFGEPPKPKPDIPGCVHINPPSKPIGNKKKRKKKPKNQFKHTYDKSKLFQTTDEKYLNNLDKWEICYECGYYTKTIEKHYCNICFNPRPDFFLPVIHKAILFNYQISLSQEDTL